MEIVMANQGSNNVLRDYRKGNWTVQETMVLIEAKRMDDERRLKRQGDINIASGGERSGGGKPAELRWKWVEDYCWRNNCLRSQNQCNDKWDNLMRDFKKVREYERRLADQQKERLDDQKSYWKLEKNERKVNNLPSNMLPQIYDALVDVVERKFLQRGSSSVSVVGFVTGSGSVNPNVASSSAAVHLLQPAAAASTLAPPMLQQQQQQHLPISPPPVSVLPALPPPLLHNQTPVQQQQHTVDSSDTSDQHSDSAAKRRRRGGGGGGTSTHGGAGGLGSGSTHNMNSAHEVGNAISRSASMIAEAIQGSEEREERRHRELLSLHERRLQIEESKAEINRQGINGLVDAVNKLANSILALASSSSPPPSHKNQSTPK